MAVHTLILSIRLGVIVTFEVKDLRHPEDIARAVIDTELAALASLFNYSDLTPCDLNGLKIERNTPIFHLNSIGCYLNNHPGTRLRKETRTGNWILTVKNLTGNPDFSKFSDKEIA